MTNSFSPLAALPFRDVVFFSSPEPFAELKVIVASGGHQRILKGDHYDWPGENRGPGESFVWQYTIDGLGSLEFAGVKYDLHAGEAMLLKIPEKHRYWLPQSSDAWEFIYLVLTGEEAIRLGLEIRKSVGPVVRQTPHSQTVRSAAAILSGGFNRRLNIETRCENSRRAYSFMMDLLSDTTAYMRGHSDSAIQIACEYCLDNASRKITVNDLAKAAGLSRSHFTRHFQKTTGITPQQYILQTKMGMAVHLLQNTTLPVKDVAARCGYTNTAFFCKSFKALHGVSPGVFRAP